MINNFTNLGISKNIQDHLKQRYIIEPTAIQVQAIPEILKGKDIIAQAQTGTGKTLAFLLPIMEKINVNQSFIQALVITPTRELAIQITAEAKKLSAVNEISILSVYGGQDVDKQIRKLKHGVHMVIGTPGRLLDHLRRETIDFSGLQMLVLDEADQMLHMGFLNDVEDIMNQTSKKRQTMLFSATITKEVSSLSRRYLKDPVEIHVKSKNITLDEIKQIVIETTDRGKQDALCKAIDEYNPFMAIIFCRTKRRVSALNEALQRRGYDSDELHGDLSQAKRESVMKTFRKAEKRFLVATDVAARGLDIEGITHVFNYDIPQDAESYIHRIGRTGRAGDTGVAVTFATQRDRQTLDIIEKGIKTTLEKSKYENEKESRKIFTNPKDNKDIRRSRSNKPNIEKNKRNNRDRKDKRDIKETVTNTRRSFENKKSNNSYRKSNEKPSRGRNRK